MKKLFVVAAFCLALFTSCPARTEEPPAVIPPPQVFSDSVKVTKQPDGKLAVSGIVGDYDSTLKRFEAIKKGESFINKLFCCIR